jgi:hypothetical protein
MQNQKHVNDKSRQGSSKKSTETKRPLRQTRRPTGSPTGASSGGPKSENAEPQRLTISAQNRTPWEQIEVRTELPFICKILQSVSDRASLYFYFC